ncbi:MAG: cysteine desulfurase [Lachnospiraceae bacterium]|nr:cysteine desulfurase [Lachnospiraceae bacterium]
MPDIETIRKDFPILSQQVYDRPLIYLDNAATTQMPETVLRRLEEHYRKDNANVHRGIHILSERSTESYEKARDTVHGFLGGGAGSEVIFTSGTTDSINLAAFGLAHTLSPGDRVIVSVLEHHANLLPWQRLCAVSGAELLVLPCPDGEPDLTQYEQWLSEGRVRIVALTQVSNLTGTVFPLRKMSRPAREAGALFLADGAQGLRHETAPVEELGCDFYCFSGHKVLGPTGIGVLWGKKEALELLEPLRLGGGMVDVVQEQSYTAAGLPARLEAGTPNYSGAIALAAALEYLTSLNRKQVSDREDELLRYAEKQLSGIPGLHILGKPQERAGALSFTLDDVHPFDAASVVDKFGIALRSGTHCAQPALASFGVSAALRLSPAFYNTFEEIDEAVKAIVRTKEMFQKWTKKS